jgi:phage terminase large subunit-like protein
MTAVALRHDANAPADRLVTMPPFPLDGSIRTLGVGAVEWMRENLIQPDGPGAGKPFTPSPDQVEFLLWFYSLNESARWLFNLAVRRLSKGKGKSPFAAALALFEFLGPARLDRFDDRVLGGCIGKPVAMPLVQIVAAAESQTKNTMRYVRAFCPKGGALARKYDIDVGKTQFYKLPEGTLEVITSSFTAAEGAQATFAVGDEPEHWTPTNQGDELNSTILDNLTKTGGRMVHTCNAWKPGVGSVAEATWDDWVAQEEGKLRGDQRILYDARVAPPITDEEMGDRAILMAALEHCYEGSPWVDLENIVERIWRASAKPDDSKRKYLNQPTAPADSWLAEGQWGRLADTEIVVAEDEPIVLFFDGSKSRDATALVACRVSDGFVFVPEQITGDSTIWEPDTAHDTDDVVPVGFVDLAVDFVFDSYNVIGFFADVQEWESFTKVTWPERFADRLTVKAAAAGKQPSPIAWDMRAHVFEFTRAAELVAQEIVDGLFAHDGNPILSRHVANARRYPNRWGVSVSKESPSSPKKIDAAVAMVGARMVRNLAVAAAANGKKRSGRVW